MSFLQLAARDKDEAHRAATTLELMFDLASVIAIAAAAVGLHHGIADGHWAQAVPGFLMAFFMIWWSWMNYTWFASAYDDGSAGFRILSAYAIDEAKPCKGFGENTLWIITEADRSVTTLLPLEY